MRVATPYGAFELKSSYQKNFSIAVLISCLVYLVLFGSFVLLTHLAAQKPVAKRVITIKSPIDLGAPPSLTQNVAHQIAVAAPAAAAAPSVGVPKAVPDEQVKETVTLASQAELGVLQNPTAATETGKGESLSIQIPQEEYLPAPGEFVPYEEAPVPIKWVKPDYPELARKSGVEGKVFVEALVDKQGKVREARCVKEGSVNLDIFCESAVKAALKNEYKPAIANHQPIAVRVLYKIDFNLK